MNERIRELMGNTLDEKFAGTWSTMDMQDLAKFSERFAELIMLDCISQCRGVGSLIKAMYEGEEAYRFKSVADTCEKMIKQRFGVE